MKNNYLKIIEVLMRLTFYGIFIQILCLGMLYASTGKAQKSKSLKEVYVELDTKEATLVDVFSQIESQTGFYFNYDKKSIDRRAKVSLASKRESIEKVLIDIGSSAKLHFRRINNNISVYRTSEPFDRQKVVLDIADIDISGKITDENGEGLPGASVVVKGTASGTTTDLDGKYKLTVPEQSILVVSFVGYKTSEILVGSQSVIDVQMELDAEQLEEVVVIGYGVQESRKVTGSIASIKTKKLEDQPVGTVLQKLQGQFAGVQINQTSGTPGSGMSIRIRGAASISAGNAPLYVVDGFPIVNGINSINPNEIENISVLKGTAASSLYGSRAANGVVLVTTKQASQDGITKVSLDITTGWGVIPENLKPDVMNAHEFLTSHHYFWEDRIRYQGASPDDVPEIYRNPDSYTGPDIDWYDELLRTSHYTNYNMTLTRGTDRFQTSNTIAYNKQNGNILNTDYQRFSLRSNNIFKVNGNIRAGVNIAPTFYTSKNAATDGSYNIIFAAITTPPIFDPDELGTDGKRVGFWPGIAPVWNTNNVKKSLLERVSRSQSLRLISNAFVELDFLKDFQFRSAVGIDYISAYDRNYNPSTVGGAPWENPPMIASGSSNSEFTGSWTWENTLKYNKTINGDHQVEALISYSAQKFTTDALNGSGSTFADDEIPYISAATNRTSTVATSEWSLASIVGRLNYSYKGKYLLSAAFRRDGSSRFGIKNRWGSFPSVSAGWIISDEGFAEGASILSFLKLRAEYGKLGNFDIGNYSHLGAVGASNYVLGSGVVEGRAQTSISNSGLTWESTTGLGIGLDAGLFEDRLMFTFDYYKKTTDGLLFQVDLPLASGFSSINSNIGEFDFWGYEFSLSSKNLTGELKWTTDFNISFDRNKVIRLGTEDTPIGGGAAHLTVAANKTIVGHPIGQFWGLVYDGVYMNQEELDSQPKGSWNTVGSARFKDVNGDGVITDNEDDRTFIGNPQPDFTFGINNSFSYKNFDMSILVTGSSGNKLQYDVLGWTEVLEGLFNMERYMLDRWRSPENPGSGDVPGTATGNEAQFRRISTRNVLDASHLTIKNITFGYNLPKISSLIQNVRVYGSIQQVLVISSYPGANPEASNQSSLYAGSDGANYPIPRTIALGLNVTF